MDLMMPALSSINLGRKGQASFCTKLMSKGAMGGCGPSRVWHGLAGKERRARWGVVGRTPPCELSRVASSGSSLLSTSHTLPRGTDASRSQIFSPKRC